MLRSPLVLAYGHQIMPVAELPLAFKPAWLASETETRVTFFDFIYGYVAGLHGYLTFVQWRSSKRGKSSKGH